MQHTSEHSRATDRRGSVLVEFALISFVFYLLLAAVVTFGFILYAAQGTQQAAEVAAREISQTPLPADTTLEEILYGNANTNVSLQLVRQRVFDQHYLVLNLDTLHGRSSLQELIGDLPIINQQLYPLMIFDTVGGTRVLRYPGALFQDTDNTDDPADPPPSGFLVAIPLVVDRADDGTETIDWIPVIEEVDSTDNPDPFRITSPQRGVVALRINYPMQSSMMSSFRPNPEGPFEPSMANPNVANDGGVSVVDQDGFMPSGNLIAPDGTVNPTYSGQFGLGQQQAFGSQQLTGGLPVRPFRRVISSQAIFRREVFE